MGTGSVHWQALMALGRGGYIILAFSKQKGALQSKHTTLNFNLRVKCIKFANDSQLSFGDAKHASSHFVQFLSYSIPPRAIFGCPPNPVGHLPRSLPTPSLPYFLILSVLARESHLPVCELHGERVTGEPEGNAYDHTYSGLSIGSL